MQPQTTTQGRIRDTPLKKRLNLVMPKAETKIRKNRFYTERTVSASCGCSFKELLQARASLGKRKRDSVWRLVCTIIAGRFLCLPALIVG
jgi:hypothetical protein